jgi:PAS domain S-box-containing protein
MPHGILARFRGPIVLALLALELPLGQAAVLFAPEGASISAFWPNAGLSVVILLLARPRWRPALVVAIYVVSVAANLVGGRPWELSLGLGFSTALEAPLVAWILLRKKARGCAELLSLDDFLRLVLATLVGAVAGGFVAATAISLLGAGDFLITLRVVVPSHAAALIVFVPLALRLPERRRREASTLEAGLQWGLLGLLVWVVFAPSQELPLAFLPYPVLVWGAARLSPREAILQLITFSVLFSALTAAGRGQVVSQVSDSGMAPELIGTLIQAQVIAAALVTLPLALVKTHRLMALDSLTQSHSLVNNILLSTTGNAILGLSLTGRIEFFNVGAEHMSGDRADDVVGRAFVAVVSAGDGHPQLRIVVGDEPDTAALRTLIEPFLHSPKTQLNADWEFLRSDGEIRILSLALTKRFGEDGEAIGYLGIADDVTERRHREETIAVALETERQINERLAQVDQTKNDFMATVSHELRTPITSIIGYSQLLLSDDTGTLPTMHHQIVGRIERNGRRLMGLIEDMLTMSQVELGDFRFRKEVIDLREPVRLALDSVQPAVVMGQLSLQVRPCPDTVRVCGDSDKLERVFANLVSNAVKFSSPGDTIQVQLTIEDSQAIFRVTDTGVGISPDDQTHLFDRFFRGADAHAMAIQGAGLGLSIASSIVDGHDGRIEVLSELGHGSTFTVRLPLFDEGQPCVGESPVDAVDHALVLDRPDAPIGRR